MTNLYAAEIIVHHRMDEMREAVLLERRLSRELPRRHPARTLAAALRRLARGLAPDRNEPSPPSATPYRSGFPRP